MIYEKIVSRVCWQALYLWCRRRRRPIIVLRTDEALKMRSNKIDGSYEIAGRSLKATADDLESDRWEYRQDRRSGASNEELARDRAEILESLNNLRDSRREVEKDRRELNRDLSEYYWRYGDRDRDGRGWWDSDSWRWR